MVNKCEDIEQQLKEALINSPLSRYRIAKMTGLSQAQLSYFVNGKRTLTFTTAARLAGVLGLELKPKKKGEK
ncbi:MAG: helix-turn-helix transcriptional regulator [Sedimentisphaerales bacterium]|nr:helix-turn-helix transcriptional regulator [Sedimentisphaerales bacterium]